jgi:hypothetical protein
MGSMKCRIWPLAIYLTISIGSFFSAQSQTQVGYTSLTAEAGSIIPVGTALFSYRNSEGILVAQAGVSASEPIYSGRLFADESGPNNGIALVNPSTKEASVIFVLRDNKGLEAGRITRTLKAGTHLPIFIFQLFKNLPSSFTGSLTFESDQKLAAIALRQSPTPMASRFIPLSRWLTCRPRHPAIVSYSLK